MKLKILERLLNKKIEILDENFKVIMDSKYSDKNTLFFAINNGNNYAKIAESNGSFVIYDDKNIKISNGIYVENTVKFMQKFALEYREKKDFIVIAITGSNGKTTVKDIIYSVLKEKGEKVFKTYGNYNNHIGLPFSILSCDEKDRILVLELGMSNLGEIDFLANIAKPDYSIITNIGQSHLEALKTEDNVFKAKTEIIKHTKNKVFVNGEDLYLSDFSRYEDLSKIVFVKSREYKTNLIAKHNKMNISLVDNLLSEIGFNNLNYENLTITDGRFQIIERKDTVYINDAYNASPLSMKSSLETFSEIYNDDLKIVVLGDMLELGENENKFHEDIADIISKIKIDILFLYGKRMRFLFNKLKALNNLELINNKNISYSMIHYMDKEDIKKDLKKLNTNKKKIILLKASRGMKLEEIMECEN